MLLFPRAWDLPRPVWAALEVAFLPSVPRRPVPVHCALCAPPGVCGQDARGVDDGPAAGAAHEAGLDAHGAAALGALRGRPAGGLPAARLQPHHQGPGARRQGLRDHHPQEVTPLSLDPLLAIGRAMLGARLCFPLIERLFLPKGLIY